MHPFSNSWKHQKTVTVAETSTRELESDDSSCATCFARNSSVLWTYVTNTCKSRYIFQNFFAGFVFLSYFLAFYLDILL